MADGTPMHLSADNAASRTLPLGTTAIVTNLETGLTAHVTIRDRGPYVDGRLIDLSPATARKIGLEPRQGLDARGSGADRGAAARWHRSPGCGFLVLRQQGVRGLKGQTFR